MTDRRRITIRDLLANPYVRLGFEILGLVLAVWLMVRLSNVLTPVLLGLVLAYMLEPVVAWCARRGLSRSIAASLVFGVGALLTLAVLVVGVPKAAAEGWKLYLGTVRGDVWTDTNHDGRWEAGEPLVRDLNGNGRGDPSYLKAGREFLASRGIIDLTPNKDVVSDPDEATTQVDDFDAEVWLKTQLKQLVDSLRHGDRTVLNRVLGIFGMFSVWLLILVLIPVFGYVFSLNLPRVSATIIEHIPVASRERTLRILAEINQVVGAFFRGRVAICLLLGILACIGFRFSGVPSWLVLGIVMGIGTAIPLAAGLTLVPVGIMLFLSGGSEWQYVGAAVTFAIVQGLEPVLIAVIMGKGVEMHPLILIVGILAFGTLFGAVGALLAVPLAATFRIVMREFIYPHIRRMAGLDEDHPAPDPGVRTPSAFG